MSAPDSLEALIVGAGLVGTSIGLKLKSIGAMVSFEDTSATNLALAEDLIGNSKTVTNPRVAFVTVPPQRAGRVAADLLRMYPNSIVVDVTSVKTQVISDVESLSEDLGRFIPSHPVAGREVVGPASAQGDLFEGRPWIITPLPENNPEDLRFVEDLVRALGATPYRMNPETHDELFAQISHFPQIVSTLLAGSLLQIEKGVELSGQGLRDVTRLADSDPKLWLEIITLNADQLAGSFNKFRSLLNEMEDAVSAGNSDTILRILSDGQAGRKLIAGKHGGRPRNYLHFRIVVEDRPGVLGDLFVLCSQAGVNVEDLDLEHTPNQETGLITIAIAPDQDEVFSAALRENGWRFHRQVGPA